MNTTHISANQNNKTATITGNRFIAEISPDYCLINLEYFTISLKPDQLRNMEVAIEMARAIWEEAGIILD
jgi:hypothetical protein